MKICTGQNTIWYMKQLGTWVELIEKVDLWLVDSRNINEVREYKINLVVACYDYL